MPAMATQQPPKRAAESSGRAAGQAHGAARPQAAESKGLRAGLYNLPKAAGMAIMALLLIASLFIGNFRALQNATPKAFLRQGDVKSIIEDRIDAANNVLSVAQRLNLGDVQAAQNAINALEGAKSARDISRADQELMAAVSMFTTAALSGEDARSMQRAADDFAEQGSFLRQEARAYNEKAEKAEKLYDSLPTKFMLPEPDVYEGI